MEINTHTKLVTAMTCYGQHFLEDLTIELIDKGAKLDNTITVEGILWVINETNGFIASAQSNDSSRNIDQGEYFQMIADTYNYLCVSIY